MTTKTTRRIILCLVLAAVAAWSAPPHKTKLAGDLPNLDPQTTVPVIIQWTSAPDDLKDAKVANLGGRVTTRFRSIKGGAYKLSGAGIQSLADDPDVAYITPDRPVSAKLDNTAGAVNASAGWSVGLDGSGIGVAVIDSGISPNDNLGYKHEALVWSYDF